MISIIIPIFNSKVTIESTLLSVKNQKFENFEVLIINDGSEDNSIELASKIIGDDKRFKIINQQNKGVSSARKTGIINSQFNLLAFLDSDDLWESDYLISIINLYNQFPSAIAYSTLYKRVLKYGNNSAIITKPIETLEITKISNVVNLLNEGKLPFYTSSIVVKKVEIEKIGYFATNIRCGEDLLAWIKLSILGDIILFSKACVIYNLTINSNGRFRRKNDRFDEFSIEINKMHNVYDNKSLSKLLSVWHIARFLNFLVTERSFRTLHLIFLEYFLIVKSSPINIKNYLYIFLIFTPSSLIDKYILYKI
jgi:glycosyltransferase involved in cell wall biosynthesis